MVRSKNLKALIWRFIYYNTNKKDIVLQPAGIWQGIDSYKDMNMFIMRDVHYSLQVLDSREIMAELIRPDLEWCNLHFEERVSGEPLNPGESYKIWPYAKFTDETFLKPGKKFDHSYMERFWPKKAIFPFEGIRFPYGDYSDVIEQLAQNPLTRQAYLPIFFPEDTGAVGSIRVPCTLGYLFEIFDNKLDITYYIRSCDAYRHLRNDVYLATLLLIHTKEILLEHGVENLKTGKLIMKIANLHVFENDLYPLKKKEIKLEGIWNQEQE